MSCYQQHNCFNNLTFGNDSRISNLIPKQSYKHTNRSFTRICIWFICCTNRRRVQSIWSRMLPVATHVLRSTHCASHDIFKVNWTPRAICDSNPILKCFVQCTTISSINIQIVVCKSFFSMIESRTWSNHACWTGILYGSLARLVINTTTTIINNPYPLLWTMHFQPYTPHCNSSILTIVNQLQLHSTETKNGVCEDKSVPTTLLLNKLIILKSHQVLQNVCGNVVFDLFEHERRAFVGLWSVQLFIVLNPLQILHKARIGGHT